jgi:hypothetical protein
MSGPFAWRKYLKVHPAADKVPMMSQHDLVEMADDIKANGLRAGITILGKRPDRPGQGLPVLIDGRNRLEAMALAGLLAANNEGHLCIRVEDERGLRLITYNYREGDPDKLVASLNVYRRHLRPETKREVIARLLETDPTKSNRAIAAEADADEKTVRKARADWSAPEPERVTGRDGKS